MRTDMMISVVKFILAAWFAILSAGASIALAANDTPMDFINTQIAANAEVGAIIHNATLARAVEAAIETDMAPGNSWSAATDNPDQYVSLTKRSQVRFYQLLPIKPLL